MIKEKANIFSLHQICEIELECYPPDTVVPSTFRPDNLAALATAEAKSVSARKEEPLELDK